MSKCFSSRVQVYIKLTYRAIVVSNNTIIIQSNYSVKEWTGKVAICVYLYVGIVLVLKNQDLGDWAETQGMLKIRSNEKCRG